MANKNPIIRTINNISPLKEFRHKLPPKVRAERERIKAKMTILNMRGKNGNTR
jgi:hypothetical protein